MGILDMYKKQYEEDKKNENFDLPENCTFENGFNQEDYETELKAIREKMDNFSQNTTVAKSVDYDYEENDITFSNYTEKLKPYKETELPTEDFEVRPVVRRAYCPVCGKEIVNSAPTSFNPFTLEKVCAYKCDDCNHMMNLEYSYPRVVYIDNNGNEINAYGL
jgi:hypothetical protein